jgi:hypothetical protein
MKTTIALALSAAALFASAAASADDKLPSAETYSGYTGFVSTKSRADVQAELRAALQRGEVVSGEQYPERVFDAATGKSRAQVRAELAAYRRDHRDLNGEASL